MSDLLHIEVSPMGDNSISRSISKEFLETFQVIQPNAEIASRDLDQDPIPHFNAYVELHSSICT